MCGDRKSTRLNPSHLVISYAVFCLKKKKEVFLFGPVVVCYGLARFSVEFCREPDSQLGLYFVFFFNDPAPSEIYTLSLPDALPICHAATTGSPVGWPRRRGRARRSSLRLDRKSTRLNSSHLVISYAVFCLKKN